jgi:hypothetical protein
MSKRRAFPLLNERGILQHSERAKNGQNCRRTIGASLLREPGAWRRRLVLRVLLPAHPQMLLVLQEPGVQRRGLVLRVLLPAHTPPLLVLRQPGRAAPRAFVGAAAALPLRALGPAPF